MGVVMVVMGRTHKQRSQTLVVGGTGSTRRQRGWEHQWLINLINQKTPPTHCALR